MFILRTPSGPKIIVPPIGVDINEVFSKYGTVDTMSLYISLPCIGIKTGDKKINPNFKFVGEENWSD